MRTTLYVSGLIFPFNADSPVLFSHKHASCFVSNNNPSRTGVKNDNTPSLRTVA